MAEMAVQTFTWMSAPSNASDAQFRGWAKGVRDAFLACGWVQTADTGQLNLDSATVPGVNNTAAGFLMFRLDDELHATHPVFVRFEPGRGSAAGNLRVWFSVGRGTDGAGALTGVLHASTDDAGVWGGASTSEFVSYASGDGSSIVIAPWAGYGSAPSFFFAVERSRSTSGAATGEGLLVVFRGPGSTGNVNVRVIAHNGTPGQAGDATGPHLLVRFPYAVNGNTANVASSAYFTSTLSKDGVVAPVLPVPCMAPGVTPWVSNIITAVHPGDAGALSVIQAATINGATRYYRAWAWANGASGTVFPAVIGSGSVVPWWPAILWDEP